MCAETTDSVQIKKNKKQRKKSMHGSFTKNGHHLGTVIHLLKSTVAILSVCSAFLLYCLYCKNAEKNW